MKEIAAYRNMLLLGWIILLLVGCRKENTPAPQDDRGRLLTTLVFSSLLDWSVDGRELYYWTHDLVATATEGNDQLHALNVQTGERRLIYNLPMVLATTSTYRPLIGRVQSPDGQYLYLIARRRSGQEGYILYRVSTRQLNQTVAIDSSYDRASSTQPYAPNLLLSPDGTRLVFQHRPDSVRIHNFVARTATSVAAYRPIDFSPDGSRLLLYRSDRVSNGYRDVSLADFSEKPLDVYLSKSQFPYANIPNLSQIKWHMEGVRYVYSNQIPGPAGLFLWNATKQTSSLLRQKSDGEGWVSGLDVSWSADGKRLFFWVSNGAYRREEYQQYLYTTELSTLKTDKLATYIGQDGEPSSIGNVPPLLSYDGTQLIYTLSNKLYVVAIPQ